MRTLAGWCVRHRRVVVLLWLAVLVSSIAIVSSVGTSYSNDFQFPHTQSFDAINLLKSVAPSHSGDTEEVVFGTSGNARLTDPNVGLRINKLVDEINKLPHVTPVTTPYDAAGNLVHTTDINANRTVGFFQVPFDKQSNNIGHTEAKNFVDTVTKTSGDGPVVEAEAPAKRTSRARSAPVKKVAKTTKIGGSKKPVAKTPARRRAS